MYGTDKLKLILHNHPKYEESYLYKINKKAI